MKGDEDDRSACTEEVAEPRRAPSLRHLRLGPTEPVATRPFMLQEPGWGSTLFHACKNVSKVFYDALGRD